MGSWSAGLYDDDLSQQVKEAFHSAIADGLNVPDATKQALWKMTDAVHDDERAPVVYLALAALQLEQGQLEDWLKVIALSHILQGTGLEQWEEAGEEALAKRKSVLGQLLKQLQAEMPRRV
jgi:hypothetical protein